MKKLLPLLFILVFANYIFPQADNDAALMMAIANQDFASFKLEVDKTKNLDGILGNACMMGTVEMVEYLISKGVNVNYSDPGLPGMTAVLLTSDAKMLKVLIDAKANLDIQAGTDKRTALMNAALAGKLDLVQELVDNHANTSLVDAAGLTALMMSSLSGQKEVFDYLYRIDPDYSNLIPSAMQLDYISASLGRVKPQTEVLMNGTIIQIIGNPEHYSALLSLMPTGDIVLLNFNTIKPGYLENDLVSILGKYLRSTTYTTTQAVEKTVPEIKCEIVRLLNGHQ